jgi:GNAT superfamily N-acetyltransferase
MSFSWSLQAFDTEILGRKTAKITSQEIPQKEFLSQQIISLLTDLKKNDITYATYRFPANNYPLIHALEAHEFVLIDILMSLEQSVQSNQISVPTSEFISQPNLQDHSELIQLASRVFALNRFYNDPLIDPSQANAIYAKWMENSLNGQAADEVLIYKEEKILGFVTLQKTGHIPLVGVSQEARGKGIAKSLVFAALQRLKEMGAVKAEIETQVINTPALRAYSSCGFKLNNAYVTYRITP